ncbi:MAG: hypothetical protein ACYC4L_04640 [Chloroflexota bacterium]
MAFDLVAPMTKLEAMLLAAGIQSVQRGAPNGLECRVSAYVALGSGKVIDKTTGGNLLWRQNYFVGIGYRVANAEAGAETTLATVLVAFVKALYGNRTLSGTVENAVLTFDLSDEPRYQLYSQQEFRVYPLVVTVDQYETVVPA